MKRRNMIEALCYENFVLKNRYNELINYIAKLETDITNLKQMNSTENRINSSNTLNNEINKEPSTPTISKNVPIVMVDEPTITSAPVFQISRYCSSVAHNHDKSDTISELTM